MGAQVNLEVLVQLGLKVLQVCQVSEEVQDSRVNLVHKVNQELLVHLVKEASQVYKELLVEMVRLVLRDHEGKWVYQEVQGHKVNRVDKDYQEVLELQDSEGRLDFQAHKVQQDKEENQVYLG